MSKLFIEHGFTLIGAPWSGKSSVGKLAAHLLEKHLEVRRIFHDMDNDGLEWPNGWGKGGVARQLSMLWDDGFLEAEWDFVLWNYWRITEWKPYNLDRLLFASSWSLPLSKAMEHIRARSKVILIDVPVDVLELRASPHGRIDGNTRIVGMNGAHPRFSALRAALKYRWEIYKHSTHITFPYKEESLDETANRLCEVILGHGT